MTTSHNTLIDLLSVDFARVCRELEHARLLRDHEDSSARRAAVSECERWIDAVLDLFLLLRRPMVPGPGGLPSILAPRHAAMT